MSRRFRVPGRRDWGWLLLALVTGPGLALLVAWAWLRFGPAVSIGG